VTPSFEIIYGDDRQKVHSAENALYFPIVNSEENESSAAMKKRRKTYLYTYYTCIMESIRNQQR